MGGSTNLPIVEFKGVSRTFQGSDAPFSLSSIDLRIPRGAVVLVAGPSGSGKSTLLNLIAALDRPDSGEILCEGEPIARAGEARRAAWRSRVGFVFQHHLLPSGTAALDAVAAPLLWTLGCSPAEATRRAREVLDAVGLGAEARQKVERLSGGQRQRVAIARALAAEPPLVLADEPTAQLDRETAATVSGLLRDHVRRTGATMLVVSHEDQPGDWDATMKIAMEGGKLREE